MVGFGGYKSGNEKPNGYGGGKTAWLDEIRWIPVPEVATRVAQVETCELEFADDLNLDAYERLRKNPNVKVIVSKPYYWLFAEFNKKGGPMSKQARFQGQRGPMRIRPNHMKVAGVHHAFSRGDSSRSRPPVA